MTRILLWGAAAGLGWGIAARFWMRLITMSAEFTWEGTIGIVAMSGLLGIGWGCAWLAANGKSKWWLLGLIPGHVLFMSPGAMMAPASFLGGLLFAGRGWIPRAVGAAAIIGSTWLIWSVEHFNETFFRPLPLTQQLWMVGGGLLLNLGLAWGTSYAWRVLLGRHRDDHPAASVSPEVVRTS